MSLFAGMLFFLPIFALYAEQELFTLFNVGLIFSVEAIAVVLFEYPTGAVADLIGRKKSMIMSGFCVFIGFIFLAIGGSMTMFIIYAVINAFSRSLFSGSDSAFIYDTLKEESKEKYFKKIIGMKYALWPIGASIGSVIGGYLALISFKLTIILTLIPTTIAIFLSFLLIEPRYKKENHGIFKQMFKSSGIILRNSNLIILLISALILIGIGDSIHSLKPIFFQFLEVPIHYFGYIFAISFGVSALGHYYSHEISEKLGDKWTVVFASLGYAVPVIIATFVSVWLAVGMLLLKQLFYGFGRPATEHLINMETESSTRATVISGYNFMRNLGIAIFIPLIGFYADIFTISISYRIGALIMLSIPVLFLFLRKKNKTHTKTLKTSPSFLFY